MKRRKGEKRNTGRARPDVSNCQSAKLSIERILIVLQAHTRPLIQNGANILQTFAQPYYKVAMHYFR